MRLAAALFATLLFSATAAQASQAPPCAANGRITLASDAVDPDVFLWDSRARLVDYAAGQWGNTREIFAHTLLAQPGTLALIIACIPSVAHPTFGLGDEDAVGVKVLSGPHRGRYGWVLSSDVHAKVLPNGAVAGGSVDTKR